jgi:hypothetical protein
VHLAEPADTAFARGRTRHAKTDKTDCWHLRMFLPDMSACCHQRWTGRRASAGPGVYQIGPSAPLHGRAGRRCPVSGFRDYQSVIQAGVRRGDATRRVPLDPEEVRALFGRMVRQVWTPAEIDILDSAACSAML